MNTLKVMMYLFLSKLSIMFFTIKWAARAVKNNEHHGFWQLLVVCAYGLTYLQNQEPCIKGMSTLYNAPYVPFSLMPLRSHIPPSNCFAWFTTCRWNWVGFKAPSLDFTFDSTAMLSKLIFKCELQVQPQHGNFMIYDHSDYDHSEIEAAINLSIWYW